MRWNAKNASYVVDGTVNGLSAEFVSSVAENVLDADFAKRANIELGPAISEYGGPTGAVGKVFLSKRQLAMTLDGQVTSPFQPQIFDTYAYEGQHRPSVEAICETSL